MFRVSLQSCWRDESAVLAPLLRKTAHLLYMRRLHLLSPRHFNKLSRLECFYSNAALVICVGMRGNGTVTAASTEHIWSWEEAGSGAEFFKRTSNWTRSVTPAVQGQTGNWPVGREEGGRLSAALRLVFVSTVTSGGRGPETQLTSPRLKNKGN